MKDSEDDLYEFESVVGSDDPACAVCGLQGCTGGDCWGPEWEPETD